MKIQNILIAMLTTGMLAGCLSEQPAKITKVPVEEKVMQYITWENLDNWVDKDSPIFSSGIVFDIIRTVLTPADQKLMREATGVVDTLKKDPQRDYLYYITGNKEHAAQELSFYVIINKKYQNMEIGILQNGDLTKYKSDSAAGTEYPMDVIYMVDNLVSIHDISE